MTGVALDIQTLLQISGTIIATLGGSAVLILGLANWLGKVWANRLMAKEKAEYARELASLRNKFTMDTESYKVQLKKSEFIFEKEYEAASQFVSLNKSFLPSYSHPGMDRYEVCDHLAHNSARIEGELAEYFAKHGAILSSEVKQLITYAEEIAGESQYEFIGPEVPKNANTAADKLLIKLDEIERLLVAQVRSQTST